jgi:hypothetical protein
MTLALGSVPLWAALVPLGLYVILLGWLHLRRRPVALAGSWDNLLLAVAVLGLVVAGPLALLQPAVGTSPLAATMLVLLFALLVAIGILAARPRVVVYNVSIDQLRPVVAELAAGIDASARWAGETVAMPARGLQLHLDGRGLARSVSLVAVGGRPPAESWAEFSRRLRRAVRRLRVSRSPWGATFVVLGGAVIAGALWLAMRAPSSPASTALSVPAPGASHAGPRRSVGA